MGTEQGPIDIAEWLAEDEEPEADVPTSVYRLFDAGGRLLYVGITNRGHHRLHQHAKVKPWWQDVASATFEHLPNRRAAQWREAEIIHGESPVYNIVQPMMMGEVAPQPTRFVKGLKSAADSIVDPHEALRLLDRQARQHFDMSALELIQAWEAGDIDAEDGRLGYVINLLAAVRVPNG